MVKTNALALFLFVLGAAMAPSPSFGQAPTPPFTQCPPIGIAPNGCNLLIIITNTGATILQDPNPGTIDGGDDVSVGVQNNSSAPIASLPLTSPTDAFGFEGDGLCNLSPHPAGCPFGSTGYEGPGTSFTNISPDSKSGTVVFNPPIPPGGHAYFSLEEALTSTTVSIQFSVATGCPLPNAGLNAPYQQILTAFGGLGPFTWSVLGLPPGLAVNGNTGVISGVPTSTGSFPLTLQVTDTGNNGAVATVQNCNLQVDVQPISILTACPLPAGTVGMSYYPPFGSGAVISTNGGTGAEKVSISGPLPPGLFLENNVIKGVPTTPGLYNKFNLVLGNLTQACSIQINANPITVTGGCPLVAGVVGVDYNQTLTATGGTAPYAFFSRGLPPGLSLATTDPGSATTPAKAVISGRPTGAGLNNVILSVTDRNGLTNGQNCTLTTLFPGGADLLLSSSAFTFSGTPNGALAPVKNLSIVSGNGGAIPFTIAPAAGTTIPKWLTFNTLTGTTPGDIRLTADPTGLTTAPATVNLVVTGPSGIAHPFTVDFGVKDTAPKAGLSSLLIPFATGPTASPLVSGLDITNLGGGTLTYTAKSDSPWLTFTGGTGSAAAGKTGSIGITANPAGLAPGFYRGQITVSVAGGPDIVVPVTLQISTPNLNLNPSGAQFQARAGNPASNPSRNFAVQTFSTNPLAWTAQNLDNAPWLKILTTSGSSTAATPGTLNYSVDATGLPVGSYYARIDLTSAAAINSPQDFLVVLNVVPNTTAPVPDPQPAGLLFISKAGAPTTQQVTDYTSSLVPLLEQISTSTDGGLTWLTATATANPAATSSVAPDVINVTVNAAGLAQGVYGGLVNIALGGLDVRSVTITLVVPPAGSSAELSGETSTEANPSAGCTPTKAIPAPSGLPTNFSTPAAWPVPVAVQLVSDCGDLITNGRVSVSFTNGDPPIALLLTNAQQALYSGTWTPRTSDTQVDVTAQASAPNLQTTAYQISGAVTPNSAPLLFSNSTLNNFNPLLGNPVAPGTVVQIYGANLASATSAPGLPLPKKVNGTTALIGGIPAPLYYVSADQINAQIPLELTPERQYQVIVNANGALTTSQQIWVSAATPGLAETPDGKVVAQHAPPDFSLITSANPAKPGEIITLYLVGLGLTDNPIATGQTTPTDVLYQTKIKATATVDGAPATVSFSGLAPGWAGLYQVNLQIPQNARNGDLAIVIQQGTVQANAGTIPVHN